MYCTTVKYAHLSANDKEIESVREIWRGNLTDVEFRIPILKEMEDVSLPEVTGWIYRLNQL